MILIDEDYDPHVIVDDPNYPGGKAKASEPRNIPNGTAWRALWFNTINGFFQALITEAWGSFHVSGNPDKVGLSDLLDAVKKIIADIVGVQRDRIDALEQVTASQGLSISGLLAAVSYLQQYVPGLVEEAPLNGGPWARQDRGWTEVASGAEIGNAVKAFKFYSKNSFMLTNARIVDRRLRGWDLGLPYLTTEAEVYHFDTDFNNQHQETSITVAYPGEAPQMVGRDQGNGDIVYTPAVQDDAPFEMKGRSLLGVFTISATVPRASSTVEFWVRLMAADNMAVFRWGDAANDEIAFVLGGSDPAASEPAAGDPPASQAAGEDPVSSAPGVNGTGIEHTWSGGSETFALDGIDRYTWIHVAVAAGTDTIAVMVNETQFVVDRQGTQAGDAAFITNEDEEEINIDELMISRTAALGWSAFSANNAGRVPWAALDYNTKYAVFMVDDPANLRTNIFESPAFTEAVQAIIAGG